MTIAVGILDLAIFPMGDKFEPFLFCKIAAPLHCFLFRVKVL